MKWGNHLEQSADGTPWTTGHHPTAVWITGILIPSFFSVVHNCPTCRELDDHFPKWYKMIHAEFFLCLLGFQRLSLRKPKVFSLHGPKTLPKKSPPVAPGIVTVRPRWGPLRLHRWKALRCHGRSGIWMDLERAKPWWYVKMLSQQCSILANLRWEARTIWSLCTLSIFVSYTCSILGFVDGCPPQGWSPRTGCVTRQFRTATSGRSTLGRNLKSRSRRHRSHLKSMVFEVFRSFDRFSLQEDATVPRNTIWKPPHWG